MTQEEEELFKQWFAREGIRFLYGGTEPQIPTLEQRLMHAWLSGRRSNEPKTE